MGKTPAQMVTRGMALKTGVVMAPTMYDQTPGAVHDALEPGQGRAGTAGSAPR